ncbi:MAG TPA: flagellar basal body-associated FliL family protein [Paracoccaceae bacterium]|nr:flagellar basal body-associated FliL family protein [Paracoccaceae bacterium]
MRKLLPILLALIGLVSGGGAGFVLRPSAEQAIPNPCGEPSGAAAGEHAAEDQEGDEEAPLKEYVKLNNQFIVPVVESGVVRSLVILSVSLEVGTGTSQEVYAVEPKLRDSFLQVLFDHANAGGFEGAFTNSNNMEILRVALLEAAQKALDKKVSDVLIVDIVRQDN